MNRARGQAMAEFALVAPIFFLLLFGVIQLGLIMGGQNGLVSSARELARYAAPFRVATDTDATAVCANAANADHGLTPQLDRFMRKAIPGYSTSSWGAGDRTVTYSWHDNPDGTHYVQLEIHLVYRYQLYVPLLSAIIDRLDGDPANPDNKYRLDATETMRIENLGLSSNYPSVTCNV
jgi:Flp pilus assembly protein TadG